MTSPSGLWQVNGCLQAEWPVQDRGLAYGDGLFETVLMAGGHCPFWPYHRSRLLQGCARLDIALDEVLLDSEYTGFLHHVAKSLASDGSGVIKLIVTRGVGGRGYIPKVASECNRLWQLLPPPSSADESSVGVSLELSAVRLSPQPILAGLKHLNRLEYVLAGNRACEGHQPLLMDSAGRVIETLSHNIYLFDGKQIVTPRLDLCGVSGVLRRYVADVAKAVTGYALVEAEVSLDQLSGAQEIWIGNSVRGFWPVTRLVVDQTQKTWPVGRLYRQLQSSLEKYLVSCHHV